MELNEYQKKALETAIYPEKMKINYDILVYLPEDIETMKGEKILTDDFNMGAFSISIVENMSSKDLLKLENEIKQIDGVENVVSYADLTGTTIPKEMLPNEIVNKISKDNSDILVITFADSTSSEKTLEAVSQIKEENVRHHRHLFSRHRSYYLPWLQRVLF